MIIVLIIAQVQYEAIVLNSIKNGLQADRFLSLVVLNNYFLDADLVLSTIVAFARRSVSIFSN